MKLKQRTIYYQDELHDEFAGDHIKAKHIGQDYRYIRVRPLERMLHGFWYGIVAIPLARLYMKLHFSHKIINKEVLKQVGNSGFYLYGNHTHFSGGCADTNAGKSSAGNGGDRASEQCFHAGAGADYTISWGTSAAG